MCVCFFVCTQSAILICIDAFAYMRAFYVRHDYYYDDGTKNWIAFSIQTTHCRIFINILFCFIWLFLPLHKTKWMTWCALKTRELAGWLVLRLRVILETHIYMWCTVQCIWIDEKHHKKISATTITNTSAYSHKFPIKSNFKLLSKVISLHRWWD